MELKPRNKILAFDGGCLLIVLNGIETLVHVVEHRRVAPFNRTKWN